MHAASMDPFRPPDWRRRRCDDLVARRKRPSRRRDDGWTWAAWRFFRGLDRAGDGRGRERVRQHTPALAAAMDLRKGDDFDRWELEARLLSREPVDAVARRSGVSAEAVEHYVRLYFDVLGSLDASSWIVRWAIGFTPGREYSEKDAEIWLKLFAFFGGPLVLDAVAEYFRDPEPEPFLLDRLGASQLAGLKSRLDVRASILARCVPDGDARLIALGQLNEVLDTRHGRSSGDAMALSPTSHESLERLLGR